MSLKFRFISLVLPLMAAATVCAATNDIQGMVSQIIAAKESLTAVERKVDAAFLPQFSRFQPKMAVKLNAGAATSSAGTGGVDCEVIGAVTDRLVDLIASLGGEIVHKSARYGSIRIRIPQDGILKLARDGDVRRIRKVYPALTNKANVSQADTAHRTSAARQAFGVTGDGIKVGVISDSARYLSEVQATGDLPGGVTVLSGFEGVKYNASGVRTDSGEGTGMMELIYDLAPGAKLYFATAGDTVASLADAVDALSAAGCKIIVDDINMATEAALQESCVVNSIKEFSAKGGIYFSSACNLGNLSSDSSGVWEGDYVRATQYYTKDSSRYYCHDFGGSGAQVVQNAITELGNYVVLQWSDPWGKSANDYDLLILDSDGNICAMSVDVQDGDDDPIEIVDTRGAVGASGYSAVVIRKSSAAGRYIRLDTQKGTLDIGTAGATYGHSSAEKTISVAAAAAPSGRAFVSTDPIEDYSADGPRKVFFDYSGNLLGTGYLSSGAKTLLKPDVTAADAVSSKWAACYYRDYYQATYSTFGGTSAAAPHVAAIAALMLDANPSLTRDEVLDILCTTTFSCPGWNRNKGYGIVDASAAVEEAQNRIPCEQPDAPTGLTASCAWDSTAKKYKVTLSWNRDYPDGTTYTVYRSSSYTGVWDNPCKTTTATSYADTVGLAGGETVYYAVTATLSGSTVEGLGARVTATAPSKTLSSIAISGASGVTSGCQSTYVCTATYSDGSTATVSASWSFSATTTYASIGASTGVLTASTVTSAKTVTVKASYTEGGVTKTATKSVTISPASTTVHALTVPAAGGTGCTTSFTVQTAGSYYMACTPPSWITSIRNATKSGGVSITIGSGAGTTTLAASTVFTVTVSAGANATGATRSWDYLITGPENHTVRISQASQDVSKPSVEGDSGATVTGDASSGYVVKPSSGKTAVVVTIPTGVDASKVTVEVGTGVMTVTPHGAKVKIVNAGYDITDYLDVPAAVSGVIDLSKAAVKESVVKDALDTTKATDPAVIALTPSAPSIRTARTKPGLTYTFSEGTKVGGLTKKSTKTGDGNAWTPTLSVKGGDSGFYSIGVTK